MSRFYPKRPAKPGYRLIFPMVIRHWRTGRLVRRKNGRPFAIWVRRRRRS